MGKRRLEVEEDQTGRVRFPDIDRLLITAEPEGPMVTDSERGRLSSLTP